MEESSDVDSNEGKVVRLQQMSEEMKLHIAQLKAELGSADVEQSGMSDLEKEFRNKAVATALIKKMESENQSATPVVTANSTNLNMEILQSPDDEIVLAKHDVVESLSPVIVDSDAHLTPKYRSNNMSTSGGFLGSQSLPQSYFPFDQVGATVKFSPQAASKLEGAANERSGNNNENLDDSSADSLPQKFIDDPGNQRSTRDQLADSVSPRTANVATTFVPIAIVSQDSLTSSTTVGQRGSTNSLHEVRASTLPRTLKKRRKLKSRGNGSLSSNDTPSSSPRSLAEKAEDAVPVKYLQMSSNSPKVMKKPRGTPQLKYKISTNPSSSEIKTESMFSLNGTDNLKITDSNLELKCKELESQLSELQGQCEILAEENIKIKKDRRSKAEEKISSLKKRNGELANIARRLEEKGRSLQEQNVKKSQDVASLTKDMQQQKRAYQRYRARWDAEHARALAEYNDHLISSKKQLDDLKRVLKQARRQKLVQGNNGDSEGEPDILRQNQKEMLHLQKLAAAASAKVVVRSLSTPVTARQKILEESNRSLRRQITSLENSVQAADEKSGEAEALEEKLASEKEEKKAMQNRIGQLASSVATLESELQESKVETSDISLRLTDLKHVHVQLQDEYSTVHEQLAVAIQERDQAVKQCIENANKLSEIENITVTKLKECADTYRDLQSTQTEAEKMHKTETNDLVLSHEKIVSEYHEAFVVLQAKVTKLEEECHDYDEMNKTLKRQLFALTARTKTANEVHGIEADDGNNNTSQHSSLNNEPLVAGGGATFNHNMKVKAQVDPEADALQHPHEQTPLPVMLIANNTSHNLQNVVVEAPNMNLEATETEDTEIEDSDEEYLPQSGTATSIPITENPSSTTLKLFVAKYTYDPYDGPNQHPEEELPLMAGETIYVYGNMDIDGFYQGQLESGRQGLVPSNFLEPASDESASAQRSLNASVKSDHAHDKHDEQLEMRKSASSELSSHSPRAESKHRSLDSKQDNIVCSGLSVSSSVRNHHGLHDQQTFYPDSDERAYDLLLPFPRSLSIDKKLSHSVIIGWKPPHLDEGDSVEEYHVLVDGRFATAVNGNKTNAVVENIYHDQKIYEISVCAVTDYGRSQPWHCMLTHGDSGRRHSITDLRAEYITPSSVRVSWIPSNSNRMHSLSIGEIKDTDSPSISRYERQIIVPTGMFQCTVHGLERGAPHEVLVKGKSDDANQKEETAVSNTLRFTTGVIRFPDPPSSLQVEEDRKSLDFLIATWSPVTTRVQGFSNDIAVSGYALYVNAVNYDIVTPSTADNCRIRIEELADHLHKTMKEDTSCRHRRRSSRSSNTSLSSTTVFTHNLSSVSLTVKTIGLNERLSDHSKPYNLHKNIVDRLLQIIASSREIKSKSHSYRQHTSDQRDIENVESTDLRHQPQEILVPSIEITGDTSHDRPYQSHSQSSHNTSYVTTEVDDRTRQSKSDLSSSIQSRITSKEGSMSDLFDQNRSTVVSIQSKSATSINQSEIFDSSPVHNSASSLQRSSRHHRTCSDDNLVSSNESVGISPIRTSHQEQHLSSREQKRSESKPFKAERSTPILNESISQEPMSDSYSTKSKQPVTGDKADNSASDPNLHESPHHNPGNRRDFPHKLDVTDSRVGLYVALYDYDPYTMSPNAEFCIDDELPFVEGQLIKVYGDKDNDGFYTGETQEGRRGYVPSNLVSFIEVDDYTMLEDLFRRGHLTSISHDGDDSSGKVSESEKVSEQIVPVENSSPQLPRRKQHPILYVALYDYDPKESSPNIDSEIELSFSRGDFITVYGEMDEDGFFKGDLNGEPGLVPSNFLKRVTADMAQTLKLSSKSLTEILQAAKVSPTNVVETPSMKSMGAKSSPRHPVGPERVASTGSATSSRKSDVGKKKGLFSKGKRLFKKKLGGN